jgi:hypothetical protein
VLLSVPISNPFVIFVTFCSNSLFAFFCRTRKREPETLYFSSLPSVQICFAFFCSER